ncbi:hypothetical protein H8959_017089 [Pygathrix nigripes]
MFPSRVDLAPLPNHQTACCAPPAPDFQPRCAGRVLTQMPELSGLPHGGPRQVMVKFGRGGRAPSPRRRGPWRRVPRAPDGTGGRTLPERSSPALDRVRSAFD